ncbi:ribosome biogenesis GTP-binding protein YihA/YsxC [Azospirillum sp. B4]|uniref:ribosome biogenesis GTP-binding protein YihA/YsxC n=1 Tax=Azospirillum sp. B4 TaxID=95605 RepID=UPI00034D5F26|nr:ribosome biogenesis GTP-binding protein YihA/YsxC [Azospirillum sp. B4]
MATKPLPPLPALTPITPEALEAGRLLFAKECDFKWGASAKDNLPPEGLPEIAFAGRSNVGKSSLVNALTGRKTLARTSHTPGRTQQLNFFDLGDRVSLVDMPGYGYAKESKDKVEAWNEFVRAYLKGRVTLRRCCLLIDSRHGFKPIDMEVMGMLDNAAVVYQVVLTKTDKLTRLALNHVHAATQAAIKKHPAAHPEVLFTSSETGEGVPELRASLAALANP